jgi:glycosyltransferase involved in cell wall biosynthesis
VTLEGKGRNPLLVGVDARLISGVSGGVETVVIGLASGLSKLAQDDDRDEEYAFLVHPGHDDWLRPYVHGRVYTVPARRSPSGSSYLARAKRRTGSLLPSVRAAWRSVPSPHWMAHRTLPASDGTFESLGARVVHFPFQSAFLTEIPSIYHPHDLQHLHYPQFFDARTRMRRELHYRTYCLQAEMVAVSSEWARRDLMAAYQLPPSKVWVVPWAPILTEYEHPSKALMGQLRDRYSLPREFILYPAQTWPHKNHLRLLDALNILRQRGIRVPLVCTGRQNDFFREISARSRALELEEQTHWLGFVSPKDLRGLYELASGVVVPTLFEAASGPIWDAFASGVAVACSNVTSLPDQVGDAALLFDPYDPEAIASAIEKLWLNEDLRTTLAERGRKQVARFSWERTAATFRAHYRRIAQRPLTEEDRVLLASPAGI